MQLRWNSAIGKYEVRAPGYDEWSRLEARQPRSGSRPYEYDVFGEGETTRPFSMLVWAPTADGYVGSAQIREGGSARAYVAFGLATSHGDVPVSGRMVCTFGEDEIGDGGLTLDLAAGTVSGWAAPFWGGGAQYDLVQTSFAPGATTFATTFGAGGILEARFFGPRGGNISVRSKGGGSGFSAVTGIMNGRCAR